MIYISWSMKHKGALVTACSLVIERPKRIFYHKKIVEWAIKRTAWDYIVRSDDGHIGSLKIRPFTEGHHTEWIQVFWNIQCGPNWLNFFTLMNQQERTFILEAILWHGTQNIALDLDTGWGDCSPSEKWNKYYPFLCYTTLTNLQAYSNFFSKWLHIDFSPNPNTVQHITRGVL